MKGIVAVDYSLGRKIGKGSFGEVFIGTTLLILIAKNIKTGEIVAIKLVV